jgi:dGTPase
LEVAQLGRSIARSLGLNEDLVEAIALAHDLGHTPFGHAGQDALNACMRAYGGFEHNLQSLRVVDHLEERYPDFDGLNLTFETREGILKHCSRPNAEALEATEPRYADGQGGVGARFIVRTQPSLEAQLCNLADEIAYNAHDIDDGIRSGLITLEQIQSVPLFNHFCQLALASHAHLSQPSQARRLMYETIRLMLSSQVYDVVEATQTALNQAGPLTADTARLQAPLVRFTDSMRAQSLELKAFLFQHLYRHPQVTDTMDRAKRVVTELFDAYCAQPSQMQASFAERATQLGIPLPPSESTIQRVVADYIAGMTDRFALREHERISGKRLLISSL